MALVGTDGPTVPGNERQRVQRGRGDIPHDLDGIASLIRVPQGDRLLVLLPWACRYTELHAGVIMKLFGDKERVTWSKQTACQELRKARQCSKGDGFHAPSPRGNFLSRYGIRSADALTCLSASG
jgi:hypothetical protein